MQCYERAALLALLWNVYTETMDARLKQRVVVTQETRILKAPFSQAYQQAVLRRQRLTLRAFPLICTAQAGSMCRQKVGLPWVQQPCSMSGGHTRPIASS